MHHMTFLPNLLWQLASLRRQKSNTSVTHHITLPADLLWQLASLRGITSNIMKNLCGADLILSPSSTEYVDDASISLVNQMISMARSQATSIPMWHNTGSKYGTIFCTRFRSQNMSTNSCWDFKSGLTFWGEIWSSKVGPCCTRILANHLSMRRKKSRAKCGPKTWTINEPAQQQQDIKTISKAVPKNSPQKTHRKDHYHQ